MRAVVVVALAVGALVACSSGSAGATQSTDLTVAYRQNGSKSAAPTTWALHCDPAGGSLPHASRACDRLDAVGARVFAPLPRTTVCTQIYGGPQTAVVRGTVAGRRVRARFSRENGCQIARWNRVSPWLLPRAAVS
jgi:hypothetical protein